MADKAIITVGDSKTWYGGWQSLLASNLNTADSPGWTSYNAGVNTAVLQKTLSWQVDYMPRADYMLEIYTPASCNTCIVLTNFGVNDYAAGTSGMNQTIWQNNIVTLAQKFRARWPNAKVYFMYPWNTPFHDSDAATLHTWIDNAIAAANTAAGTTYMFPGPDEAVWLRCAGCLEDGTHYSHLGSPGPGNTAAATAWQTALGY